MHTHFITILFFLTWHSNASLPISRSVLGEVDSVRMGQPEDAPVWEASFRRDVSGLEIERSLPGWVRSRWERDAHGRPVRHTITGRTALRTRDYAWDVDDRLKKIVDSAHGPVEFKHDAFGNLQGALYADFQSLLRMPDAVGNLFRTSDRKDRKYGPSGQLLEATDATGTTRYEYDPEGNLVLKVMPDATQWRYRWNAAGHLEEVLRPDGLTVRFEYDPLGRRIAKSFAGRTTRWVWDGNLPLHEWTEDHGQILSNSDVGTHALPDARLHGILQDLHRQTLSPVVSQGPPPTLEAPLTWLFEPDTFAPMARLQGDARQSIVCDHLGTPLEMYDAQGERIWAAELDIYGNVRTQTGNRSLCPFRYPGQYEDLETGLHYNRFRYYDPQAGAYISQDPIGLAGGNPTLYGYVGDPNGWVDPWGLILAPASVPHSPGVYTLTNDILGEAYVGSGLDVNGRISNSSHTSAQKLLAHPDTKIKVTPVNLGTAQGADRTRILRHYEQQELSAIPEKYKKTNKIRAEAEAKKSRNAGIAKKHRASKGKKKACGADNA